MREITRPEVVQALKTVGVQAGDRLLVHSAIQFFGRPVGGAGMYLEALQEVLGPDGTLAVPAFNFGFAKGQPFDPQATPAAGMGVLAEWVRQQPAARRSPHPLQSLAVIGPLASDITSRDTPSAFDPGSAFERLLELDFRLLLLGADVQAASIVHYSEQRACVPYRYWKEFTGPVRVAGAWQEETYRMFVRDLALDPQLDLHPIQAVLAGRGLWQAQPLNYGQITLCRLADFVATADQLLTADAWALVKKSTSHCV